LGPRSFSKACRVSVALAAAALGCAASATDESPAQGAPEPGLSGTLPAALGEPTAPVAPASEDYRIAPADVLEINVFQENDLKSILRVSNQGTIVFPLIGMVSVKDRTTQEAAREIRNRLAPGYLVNPQVSVTVLEFSKRRFTVLGEVQKPGSYDMPDDEQQLSLLQAIGMAGGYTRIANPSKVTLMRNEGDKPQTFQLNARRIASGSTESALMILPGDVITVSESRF
jgi:protein involved in polysaccharide export with SLBB domain